MRVRRARRSESTLEEFALAHVTRRRIMAEIGKRPGVRLHELARLIDTTTGSLLWHIQILAKARLLSRESVGQARYFVPAGMAREDARLAAAMAILRRANRPMALRVIAEGPRSSQDVAGRLGITQAAASNALDFLVREGMAQLPGNQLAAYHITPFGRRAVTVLKAFEDLEA